MAGRDHLILIHFNYSSQIRSQPRSSFTLSALSALDVCKPAEAFFALTVLAEEPVREAELSSPVGVAPAVPRIELVESGRLRGPRPVLDGVLLFSLFSPVIP